MKTLLATLLLVAAVTPAAAGPDFATPDPRTRSAAASSGSRMVAPQDDVVFEHDSSALLESGQAQVDRAARWLRRHPRHKIILEAYADSSGDALYNEDLATRRAQTVRDHLAFRGVKPDRIVLVVYGETVAHPDAEPLDRRVVMYATDQPVQTVVSDALERKHALSAVWIQQRALYVQSRGRPREAGGVISARR